MKHLNPIVRHFYRVIRSICIKLIDRSVNRYTGELMAPEFIWRLYTTAQRELSYDYWMLPGTIDLYDSNASDLFEDPPF